MSREFHAQSLKDGDCTHRSIDRLELCTVPYTPLTPPRPFPLLDIKPFPILPLCYLPLPISGSRFSTAAAPFELLNPQLGHLLFPSHPLTPTPTLGVCIPHSCSKLEVLPGAFAPTSYDLYPPAYTSPQIFLPHSLDPAALRSDSRALLLLDAVLSSTFDLVLVFALPRSRPAPTSAPLRACPSIPPSYLSRPSHSIHPAPCTCTPPMLAPRALYCAPRARLCFCFYFWCAARPLALPHWRSFAFPLLAILVYIAPRSHLFLVAFPLHAQGSPDSVAVPLATP
ncbi:hypothetical protein B0H13DRAFT_2317779 [Mycena leptocephala]|nr:hypothetical protein B0H13DRAFT_2317779 [Mycena leptocephala]